MQHRTAKTEAEIQLVTAPMDKAELNADIKAAKNNLRFISKAQSDFAKQDLYKKNFYTSPKYPQKNPKAQFQNSQKIYTDSGTLISEISVTNSLEDGKSIQYYPSGRKYCTWESRHGIRIEEELHYYESGQVKIRIPYINGQVHGDCEIFYISGEKHRVITFKQGKVIKK